MKSLYDIEFYMEPPVDRWFKLPSFSCMQKSFAMGAWAMLRAHYDQNRKHRLLKDGVVIEECGLQRTKVNQLSDDPYSCARAIEADNDEQLNDLRNKIFPQ